MKKINVFTINPINYLRGLIKFPLGYYSFDKCSCATCKNEGPGWGISFFFIGINFIN